MGFFAPPKISTSSVRDVPQPDDPAVEEERRRRLAAEKKRRGRASTILTGGRGLSGGPDVRRKTLLGE